MNSMLDFDFKLLQNEDFKEDSVREGIIMPLLQSFGYTLRGECY